MHIQPTYNTIMYEHNERIEKALNTGWLGQQGRKHVPSGKRNARAS